MKRTRSTAKSPLVRLVGWHAGPDAPATDTTPHGNGHRLAPGIASAAAVAATGLLGPAALAAPGDLDPSFADVGRRSDLNLDGPLWSLDVQDNDAILFAGGEEYCGYYTSCDLSDFNGRLLPDGTIDAGFTAAPLDKTVVYDTALQSDGKVVGVGAVLSAGIRKVRVFRLLPNGSLDAGFGLGGLVLIAVDVVGFAEIGRSIIIEPDGRIVVAGSRGDDLLVVRLLPNGALDPAFGTGGIFVGSVKSEMAKVVRTPGGGYRVMASWGQTCSVSGLTEAGTLDTGFGKAGVAVLTVDAPQSPGECNSLTMDATGRLLVGGRGVGAGSGNSNGYVTRLLANGTQDPGFSAAPISAQFSEVTALTIGPTGSIFVAGRDRTGFSGATVVRMLADGALDPLYGRAGSSRIELKALRSSGPVINDMRALGNDALIVGGSRLKDGNLSYRSAPFVARLLGNSAGGGPGVLSMQQDHVLGTEQAGKATVSVRRISGSKGAIAVSYAARDLATRDLAGRTSASNGLDYTAIAGRLTWADGDDSAREIVVPIASDTLAEPPEYFELALDTPEGGAGLGAYGAEIEIAPDGYPAGQLTISGPVSAPENETAFFYVDRGKYSVGTVTVTVRVAGGTATPGKDFASPGSRTEWRDVLVTFRDGQIGEQVPVWIARDDKKEKWAQQESFTLELVSPTGGAALSAQTKATVAIVNGTSNSSGGSGGGGGGAFSWFATLLLGLGGGLRRLLTGDRRHQPSA